MKKKLLLKVLTYLSIYIYNDNLIATFNIIVELGAVFFFFLTFQYNLKHFFLSCLIENYDERFILETTSKDHMALFWWLYQKCIYEP